MQKYEILAKEIQKRINHGDFGETGKLPTERELMDDYHMSRNTVRAALKTLLNHGVIYTKQGSGVYVRKASDLENTLPIVGKPGQVAKNLHVKESQNVLLALREIEADESLCSQLQCAKGTSVYAVERIRIMDGKRFAYEKAWYLKDVVKYLNKEICESSIYRYLQEDMKLNVGFTDKYITAIKLSEKEAEYLGLLKDDPGLVICDHVYTDHGKLFNISKIVYNYNYTKLYAAIAAE